jgi:hypothetical protein
MYFPKCPHKGTCPGYIEPFLVRFCSEIRQCKCTFTFSKKSVMFFSLFWREKRHFVVVLFTFFLCQNNHETLCEAPHPIL